MNTEKRYFLAIALSFVVLIVFYGPMAKKNNAPKPIVENATSAEASAVNPASPEPGTVFSKPVQKTYELQNEIYTAEFTTKSGGVEKLTLKEWGKRKMGEVDLIEKVPDFNPWLAIAVVGDHNFEPNDDYVIEKADSASNRVSFVREAAGDLRIRKTFELVPQKSALHLTVEFENLSASEKEVSFDISNQIHFSQKHDRYELDQLESFVALQSGKVLVKKKGKIAKQPFEVTEPIEWQSLSRKYLSITVKPDVAAASAITRLDQNQDAFESTIRFAPQKIAAKETLKREFVIYAGPEYYNTLKEFGIEDLLIQGTWGAFRHWLFLALRFCKDLTGSYGFAILLMTLLLKILFSPFTHMSFSSMRKMQTIQPKLKSIQTQFKNDPARMNKETMELYKRNKVNPMGGCLPMLIQIPIFIGFYQVLAQFVELKGVSFFWIKDLTEPDRLAHIPGTLFDLNLLPILMIITMILQQKVTPQPASSSPEQAKMMQFMPIIFGFLFYSLPSGLVLYWTLNNLLTVIHQTLFHRSNKVTVLTD